MNRVGKSAARAVMRCRCASVRVAAFCLGVFVGVGGVGEFAQRGVPVGFQGVGDEPVGGVDGEVAAAGLVGVVVGALDVGGADAVGIGGSGVEFVGDGERDFEGQWGEGV